MCFQLLLYRSSAADQCSLLGTLDSRAGSPSSNTVCIWSKHSILDADLMSEGLLGVQLERGQLAQRYIGRAKGCHPNLLEGDGALLNRLSLLDLQRIIHFYVFLGCCLRTAHHLLGT